MGQRVEAFLGLGDRFLAREPALDDLIIRLALHGRRLTGAALVQEHDVAIPAYQLEGLAIGGIEFRRGLAGTAGDRHEGVGLGLERQGRHDGDEQLDDLRARIVGICMTIERAAACLDPRKAATCPDAAVFELERRFCFCKGGICRHDYEQCGCE